MATMIQGEMRQNNWIEKLVKNKLFWLLFCTFFFVYPIMKSVNRELPDPLPKMYTVPEFNLTDENGKPFGSKDLKGRVYLANFHFTNCPTICGKLMQDLRTVQKRLKGVGQKVAIVSFTVDPENDNSKVLFKHARKYHANPFIWNFLTGNRKDINSLLLKGFKVPMGEVAEGQPSKEKKDLTTYDIAHSGKLVLVDQDGVIRGYYSTEKKDVNVLMIDIGLLINRKVFNVKDKEA